MNELQNLQLIKIPLNPDNEWIWTRILISIDFYLLKNPTSLQWALLKILSNLTKFDKELTTETVAQKLGVEKSIVEEGLTNLVEEDLITLQPRKKSEILQNYNLVEEIAYSFNNDGLITTGKSNKKILLFYDYKDERTYSYQIVEKPDEDLEEIVDESVFELILLALIEQIWVDIESNPNKLVGESDYTSIIEHKLLKDLKSLLIESVQVNFL